MHQPRVRPTAWISKGAISRMLLDLGHHDPTETGGVVMGYWVTDLEVVITEATSAGPRAGHRGDAYEPDVEHDLQEIARVYAESGRRHTYLGDWHTHLAAGPGLSRRDRKTLRAIATDKGARAPVPLMVVVASWDGGVFAAVWCRPAGARRTRSFRIKVFEHAMGSSTRSRSATVAIDDAVVGRP